MKKETELRLKILSLLNELELSKRIPLIESIGKRLRQQNSIEITNEVKQDAIKRGTKKKIEVYPV
jgi:hypothetical protein